MCVATRQIFTKVQNSLIIGLYTVIKHQFLECEGEIITALSTGEER